MFRPLVALNSASVEYVHAISLAAEPNVLLITAVAIAGLVAGALVWTRQTAARQALTAPSVAFAVHVADSRLREILPRQDDPNAAGRPRPRAPSPLH